MILPRRWTSLAAPVITVVILGTGMLAPSSAHAECGSYVVYTNPAHQPADSQPMGEHRAPVGCHGPGCSKVPAPAPMPQAPPTLRILADQTLIVLGGDSFVPPSSQSVPADSADGEVVRRPADVYHPPR
jgi:hypothetical protein